MIKKPQVLKKTVRLLTDPVPEYVSLVRHGANQTPLRVVKRDGVIPSKITVADLEEFQHLVEKASINFEDIENMLTPSTDIQKMVFSNDVFPSEKDVIDYMRDKGYEGFNVSKENDSYIINALDTEAFQEDSVKTIETDDGVIMYLGIIKDEDSEDLETSEDDDNILTSEKQDSGMAQEDKKVRKRKSSNCKLSVGDMTSYEVSTKYDYYAAAMSRGMSLEEVMQAGADGLPPAYYEMTQALAIAVRNNIIDQDMEGVRSVATEFGDMIVSVSEAMMAATVPIELVDKTFKLTPENKDSKVSVGIKKSLGEKVEEENQEAETSKEGEDSKKTTDEKENSVDETVESADTVEDGGKTPDVPEDKKPEEGEEEVSKQADSQEDLLSTLKGLLESSLAPLQESLKDVSDKVGKQDERVSALETVQQSRKSVDNGDVNDSNNAQALREPTKKAVITRSMRDSLGFPRSC